jgi:hypothetical protein
MNRTGRQQFRHNGFNPLRGSESRLRKARNMLSASIE